MEGAVRATIYPTAEPAFTPVLAAVWMIRASRVTARSFAPPGGAAPPSTCGTAIDLRIDGNAGSFTLDPDGGCR